MRLITSFNDHRDAQTLSAYLTQQGIDNQVEVHTNTDWGSHEYGDTAFRLWVEDEDKFERALQIANEYMSDPQNPQFQIQPAVQNISPEAGPSSPQNTFPARPQTLGFVTFYTLIICSFLLLVSTLSTPSLNFPLTDNIPYIPVISPPIQKSLMFDYSAAYEKIDRIIELYGIDSLKDPGALPEQGKALLQQYQSTPYWKGFYEIISNKLKGIEPIFDRNTPLFEKIREGEIWRLLTPSFLHANLFHLFFNMIWLVVLGKQMEQRLKTGRYLLFILILGVGTNVSQYLMSGPNFLGYSGILCGMLTFVWERQRLAPWEGYQLEGGTMTFITIFILLMFLLQLISFFLEIYSKTSLPVGIGNTAHLSGGILGYLLARLNFFSWHSS